MTDTQAPWEQDAGTESARAYAAFCVYRDLSSSRSLLKAWQQYRLQKGYEQATAVPGAWVKWASAHQWHRRALAYDAYIELAVRRQDEAAHVAEIAAYRQRTRSAATNTYAIARRALLLTGQYMETMKPGDLAPAMIPGYLRAAAAVMEASLNLERKRSVLGNWRRCSVMSVEKLE
jgi:hypothetical protein